MQTHWQPTCLVIAASLLTACRTGSDGGSTPTGMQESSAFAVDERQFDGARPWTEQEFLNDPEEFQFVVIGDRTGGANAEGTFALAMDQINLLRPEFVINVGDVIEGYADTPEDFGVMWDEVEGFVGKLAMPFFFTTGNHDVQGEVSKQAWLERHGASYYAFVYRDTLFMVLDSEDGSRPEPPDEIKEDLQTYQRLQSEDPEAALAMLKEFMTSEAVIAALGQPVSFPAAQMRWVEETLAAHPDVRWTFLFMHEPCWENPSDSFLEIEELLADRDYTFFAGHLHYYDYDERNGREYITMGPAGASFHHDGPGNVDHIAWITMTHEGPEIGNIALKGLFDRKGLDPEMFGAYDRKGWAEPETP